MQSVQCMEFSEDASGSLMMPEQEVFRRAALLLSRWSILTQFQALFPDKTYLMVLLPQDSFSETSTSTPEDVLTEFALSSHIIASTTRTRKPSPTSPCMIGPHITRMLFGASP